jgi:hypothetical protein
MIMVRDEIRAKVRVKVMVSVIFRSGFGLR